MTGEEFYRKRMGETNCVAYDEIGVRVVLQLRLP